jgi:hypothetical protein
MGTLKFLWNVDNWAASNAKRQSSRLSTSWRTSDITACDVFDIYGFVWMAHACSSRSVFYKWSFLQSLCSDAVRPTADTARVGNALLAAAYTCWSIAWSMQYKLDNLNQWFPKWALPPPGGGGITEVGANRFEMWKGALLLSQGGASRQVVHLFL